MEICPGFRGSGIAFSDGRPDNANYRSGRMAGCGGPGGRVGSLPDRDDLLKEVNECVPLSYRFILTILVTGAMASDLSRGKIYNIWLLPAAATGTIAGLCTAWTGAGAGIGSLAGTVLTAFIISFIPFIFGGLGAGDVKLVTVSALFMDLRQAVLSLGAAFFLAGVLAMLMLADDAASEGIPFAIPYGAAVIFLTGGVLERVWEMI